MLCGVACAATRVVEVPPTLDKSQVPQWDARGVGPLPWQGIACLDVSEDARFVVAGTISPAGDPNLCLLDENGKVVEQLRAGQRWVGEVTLSNDGRCISAVCTTPEGTAGDSPRVYGFRQGKELVQFAGKFWFRDFRASAFLFHYGDHSNHVPRLTARAGDQWVVAGDDNIWWLSPGESSAESVPLHQGMTTTFAASDSGRAVVGRAPATDQGAATFRSLVVVERGKPKPLWTRLVSTDVAPSPEPEKGVYGPPAPPYRDVKFQAPLAVAIDETGERVAVADYEGWDRRFRPADGGAEFSFSRRVMPARPTITAYDADGKPVRRLGPESFREPFWCDLKLAADGRKLIIAPHNWTSRGLGGQPFLPADTSARDLYILDIATGDLDNVRFPDAICSVACAASGRIVVGCWDRRVYLLDEKAQTIPEAPKGVEVGAASLVRASKDGARVAVGSTAGTVLLLDSKGKELWRTDLNQAAKRAEKPWTKNQKADKFGAGLWRSNGGLAHSDLGSQIVIEAPQGLLLVDPNAGASFEQNWARIQGAGLDPMQVKYVLLTHEHGDHAPGAYLWRVIAGAQVVASAEMAYILQHHIPVGTGYGLHPPFPTDVVLTEERELDLAGLKVKAIRLPGHTYGSMGYVFTKEGRTYVATGDLIMPGGVLGYSGSLDFSARDVLGSLRKLAVLKPDEVLGGHGSGPPANFVGKGIEAGEATGWSKMPPEKPNPLYGFAQTNYLVAAWLQPVLSAAYADIDGDGRPDVAVLVPKGQGSAVRVYLNKGAKFGEAPDAEVDLPDMRGGWKLRAAHLGHNKKMADLIVSSESQTMALLAQQEGLKFRVVPIPGTTRATQFLTADLNGDNRTDLVIGSRFVGGFSIATQNEDGTFRVRQTKAPTQGYFDLALADVNGDKRDDLIASNGDVFLRQADGSLAETPAFHLKTPQGESAGWTFMAAADFDNDGSTDVAFVVNDKEGATIWLYRNTKNAEEPFPKEPSAAFTVRGAVVLRDGPTAADWNGDGVPDLVLCALGKRGACILTGSPADGLAPQRVLAIPLDYEPHYDTRLGVADFDGDGRPDLAGFGPSAVGAVGVYIWLQQAGNAK
ncbi:MAG: FG-GAP-like repeat-containing protein [Planctomycetota bacterium]|nr:FG-GAP-like repeat-containing protein [Planctomycetota bacterium]